MILTRYLNKEFFISIIMIMIGLLALFSFFDFLQEINDLGKGSYDISKVIVFVILSMPGHVYEIIPLSVLIGSMYAISQLSQHSELIVMRASGFSIKKIALSLFYVGLFFSIVTLVVGDLITPGSEKNAQQLKINATDSSLSQEFRSGFWIKDGNNFVNIENVMPDATLREVHIYEFDSTFSLRTITNAKTGIFHDGQWKLENISQTIFNDDSIRTNSILKGNWKSLIRPEMMNVLIISPEKMSTLNLFRFISYLKNNNQKTNRYEVALWEKIIHPITPIVMLIFAVPFGFLQERSGGKFLKIFIGISAGIAYQIFNTMIRHVGLLNDWPPYLSALIPTSLFLAAGIYLIIRFERK
jgi:lipopolysaccharide export system permease protein